MPQPRGVDDAIARFDELAARYDGRSGGGGGHRRRRKPTARSLARKLATIAIVLAGLFIATMTFGLVVAPIGLTGLFAIAVLTMITLIFLSMGPGEKPVPQFREDMPNRAIVQRLDSVLVRHRPALPAPAAIRVDQISRQLPLLESKLAEVDPLDPLAQDARRLMGKHLPELIERYERVPDDYRGERDLEGMTVDDRLVSGLDAAREALEDLGRRLAREDLDAFQTQGRFIESRYKDEGAGS